jgi:alpha-aminoadipic semialdehyde synthase
MNKIGIRREDKNRWERRAPLIPKDIKGLSRVGLKFVVQPSDSYLPKRIFLDKDYLEAGAELGTNLSDCPIIIGIKEIPINFFERGKTYLFFSHTIKGQPYNMPMLKRIMELGCQLIDYERIVDESGRRLISFGTYAGLAGTIDTLCIFGKRLASEGAENPFSKLKQAFQYKSLAEAKSAVKRVGKQIKAEGLPKEVAPLVIGITGYGRVSNGSQKVLSWLPQAQIEPAEIKGLFANPRKDCIYKVVFKEEHTAKQKFGKKFDLKDYYAHPESYKSIFAKYLKYLTILINAIYWEPKYPKLVTRADLRKLYKAGKPRLEVIGDISCDIEGTIECTLKSTDPANPVFVYDPFKGKIKDGWMGNGPAVLAIDNLPCELAKESSEFFSQILKGFIPELAKANFSKSLEDSGLPPPLKKAVILYQGELTKDYTYLEKFISK